MARRDPGTPEVEPRYDNGRTVRFSQANDSAEIAGIAEPPWDGTRVLFLQHSSDPIVWWSQDLLFSRPDWLAEPPGRDRTASMRWYPDRDLLAGRGRHDERRVGPGGHGHNYGDFILDGWAAVAPADGWTPADTERVRIALQQTESADGLNTSARTSSGPPRLRQCSSGGAAGDAADPGEVASGSARCVRRRGGRARPADPSGCGHPHYGGVCGRVWRPPRRWFLGVAVATAIPPVRDGMAERTLPAPTGRWLLLRIPARHGVGGGGGLPGGAGHRRCARRSVPSGGRLVAAAAFGLSHVPDARATGQSVPGTVLVTGTAGWMFAWLYRSQAAWPRRCSPTWPSMRLERLRRCRPAQRRDSADVARRRRPAGAVRSSGRRSRN